MPVSKIQDYVTKVDYIQQYLDGTVKIKFDDNKITIPPVFTEKFNNKINTRHSFAGSSSSDIKRRDQDLEEYLIKLRLKDSESSKKDSKLKGVLK